MKPGSQSPLTYSAIEVKPNDLYKDILPVTSEGSLTTELEDPDLRCGYGNWKPSCLQKFNNSKCLLVVLCWFVFVQSFVVSGIVNVNTATLERRFDLSSAQVAWISSSYDLCGGLLSFVIGYLATFTNKTRMMTISAAIMAAGSLIMFLPHLIVEPYYLGNKVLETCQQQGNLTDHCFVDSRGSDLSWYVYVLIAGQVLHCIGGVAAYIVGTTVIDDSTESHNSPVYIGILHGVSALGPAIGFLFGGVMLDYYVDFDKVDMSNVDVDPDDPRWVGAWWAGFAVSSGAGLTVVILLACFAKELPETARLRASRVSEAYAGRGEKETETADFGRSWSDFLTSLRLVLSNPTWMFMTFAAILEAGVVQAFITFMPKVLQFQFGLSPAKAAVVSGALVVPAAAIGQVLGGLIPKWRHLKVRGLTIQCAVCCCFTLALSFTFVFRCQMQAIAGVTQQYLNSSQPATGLDHPCNELCSCGVQSYEPVCGFDGVQYFSPCHAGCRSKYHKDGEQTMYFDCSCIAANVSEVPTVAPPGEYNWSLPRSAKDGICQQQCDAIIFFLPFLFLMTTGTFMANTAFITATMRVVPAKERAFAYGLQGALIRFLGATPFPLLFGLMFDQVCLVWQRTCNGPGSCWIYDNQLLGQRLMYLVIAVKATSTASFFLSFLVYRPPTIDPADLGQFPADRRLTDPDDPDSRVQDGGDTDPLPASWGNGDWEETFRVQFSNRQTDDESGL